MKRATDARRALGREGEVRAAGHLEAAGYRIVDRNVRSGGVEIDLVATRPGWLVFVEVKTRRTRRLGAPEEAVDGRKRRRLVRGASAWMREHGVRAPRVRFDVVSCELGPESGWQIRHLEGAFEAGE